MSTLYPEKRLMPHQEKAFYFPSQIWKSRSFVEHRCAADRREQEDRDAAAAAPAEAVLWAWVVLIGGLECHRLSQPRQI